MRRHPLKRSIVATLGLIVLGCLWFYFAPAPLGGSTTYVVTHGVSMEPRFHTGDLALVRSQPNYHVGEVVAYHNKELHTVVMHRIIGRDRNRYIFKGDNNDFIDFEHPAASQLIGALWLHVPGAGATLQSIRSPALVGILVAAGLLILMGGLLMRRRRLRRRERRTGQGVDHGHVHSPTLPSEPAAAVLALGLIALLPFVMLAVLAFTRPSTKLHAVPVPYKQSGRFSYSAAATPGPTYASARAVTGDPLFTRVLNEVNLHFGYQFSSAGKHSLRGKASLSATLTSTSGWNTTFPLGSTTYFHGNRATVAATLNLSSLHALIQSVERTTRVSGGYTLAIIPHVSVTGSLDHLPLSATFSPPLEFSVSELEVKPTLAGGASSATRASSASLTPSTSGSVPSKRYQALFLSFKVVRVSVATARAIALVGIAAVIAGLIAMLSLLRTRKRPQDEAAGIRARYGHMIVPVAHVAQPAASSVIDVADMEALVRIAEHYDRSILHETAAGVEAFWVTDESGQFRYTVGMPAPVTREHRVAPQPAVVAASEPPLYTVSAPAFVVQQQQPGEQSTIEFPAADVYTELGGIISAFEGRTASEPILPEATANSGWTTPAPAKPDPWTSQPAEAEPVAHGWMAQGAALADGWASPEPPPAEWASANTDTHERWIARDLADALTHEHLIWPSTDETVDIGHARAGAFARVSGLN